MSLTLRIATALSAAAVFAGCNDGPKECTLGSSEGCDSGQVCEEVVDGTPTCFAPVTVEGRVFDALTPTLGIVGARVVAIDANGAARSSVVVSGADGAYVLPVAAPRNAEGAPIAAQVTLRADAAGYQTFPTAPRTALPIELSGGTDADGDGNREIRNTATDIALLPRTVSGTATVSGRIDADVPGGALVVAEQSGRAVATAISGTDGAFVLFDVPTSTTTIDAYRAGLDATAVELSVVGPETANVVLTATEGALPTVTGSVQIVNAPGGSLTSVILVLESTFVETTARGESPPGLRAADVSGAFMIENVPTGRYVALAAFENDGLVRDPDTSIGGTEIVHFEVTGGSATVELGDGFKVTGALAVVSPGAEVIETIATQDPTFTWEDDSSEDGYELRVFDAFGDMVHEAVDIPNVNGSSEVTYTWSGATLEPGMIYQFRAWSYHDEASGRVLISATEDLRGVFVYDP